MLPSESPPPQRPPSLLVFYHIPKAGGSTVREWLLRNAGVRSHGLPARLDGFVRYYEARCFVCMQLARSLPGHFDDLCGAADARRELRACREDYSKGAKRLRPAAFDLLRRDWWNGGRLAVEFHGPTGESFIKGVLPHAAALRDLYARYNGTCTLVTVVREPVDLLFSSYHMWPPRSDASATDRDGGTGAGGGGDASGGGAAQHASSGGQSRGNGVVPFPNWVRGATGLQAGLLTSPSCVEISHTTGHRNRCGCDGAMAVAAREAVRRFDLVGVTSCLGAFFDLLEASATIGPVDAPRARLQRRASRGNISAGLIRSTPSCTDCTAVERAEHSRWRWEALTRQHQRATLHAAQCDQPLYNEALARVQAPLSSATLSIGAPTPAACNPPPRSLAPRPAAAALSSSSSVPPESP